MTNIKDSEMVELDVDDIDSKILEEFKKTIIKKYGKCNEELITQELVTALTHHMNKEYEFMKRKFGEKTK